MTAPSGTRAVRWPSAPLARADGALEMMDLPAPFPTLVENLRDLERLNALFGGRAVTVAAVARLLRRVPPGRSATVLDVGTGSADIPRALVRWARRAGRPLRVIAVDRDEGVLEVARAALAGYPEIALLRADAEELPVGPESIDVVISALTLHHLEPGPAAAAMAAMDGAARVGVVINDLARGRVAYAAVWVATRLFARGAMSRHDGPLSVLRAYTPAEVRALAERAGLLGVAVRRHRLRMRWSAVRAK
jgi:2-polyprenyl-3-methyl-5-hydroxy-6-metoxy-1,4-benzoquinol methylase